MNIVGAVMGNRREDLVLEHFRRSQEVVERAAADSGFVAAVVAIAERIAQALRSGGKLLLAGNGGSAADAQHIAAEMVGRLVKDRAPLAAIALTTDTSALTAIGNDYGFDQVFARQLRALGRRGDVFVAISTSGRSPNILAALQVARDLGLVTVGFARAGQSPMHPLCDLVLAAPSEETALIQQLHITAAHAICHLVERELFGTQPKT
jgi:D-sedoheptulose 7-phosphate isomerase